MPTAGSRLLEFAQESGQYHDLRLTIHEQQTLEILDASGRARLKFALDSMVGYSLHPAGIENNAIGLVERFAKVLLNGL